MPFRYPVFDPPSRAASYIINYYLNGQRVDFGNVQRLLFMRILIPKRRRVKVMLRFTSE